MHPCWCEQQFFKEIPHDWLSYSIIWMFGWYSIVPNSFLVLKNKKPFSTFLWVKLVHLLYNICDKALKCKVFQIIRCLIKPLLKNSTQTIFQGGTPWVAELLNNMNVWMVLYCAQQFLGLKKKQKPFLHLSLSKAGPFTLESNICDKVLKCKVFQIIRCLIKPLLKNSIQTIFQGGTPWVAELLNNNVWMVLYCSQQLVGLKKKKPLLHLSLSKAGPFTLESHICVKAWRSNLFQIISCLKKPWMAELLNNMNVWMVLYCAQQFLGLKKKNKKPFSTFLWVKLVHLL